MLTIVCVRWGDKFSPDYVNILYSGVKKHLSDDFRFVCVTDQPEQAYLPGIETALLPDGLRGWWGKLWLFSQEFQQQCTDRVLFFDLDTIITGRLETIAGYKGDFAILRDFYHYGGYGSGMMAWKRGYGQHIWDSWVTAGKPEVDGGDQAWIEKCVFDADLWQEIYPRAVVSYKEHATDWPPDGASVVCFHGFPKPHECKNGWVPLLWNVQGPAAIQCGNRANVTVEDMLANIKANLPRDLPWMSGSPVHNGSWVIVGGGPSLQNEWDNIRQRQKRGQTIVALNGTLDRLVEKGIKPDYFVMMDARPENLQFVERRHDVKYLINAVCHPSVFDHLAGKDVTVWHSMLNGNDTYENLLKQYDKPWGLLPTGNTVGLTALFIGWARGYRKIHLYGMDSSYQDGQHHAYKQALNDGQATHTVWAHGKPYECALWMLKQAEGFQEFFRFFAGNGCSIQAHGTGLLPDLCRHLNEQVRHNLKERQHG